MYVPERKRSLVLLNLLKDKSYGFKSECINQFLNSDSELSVYGCDPDNVKKLLDVKTFRVFFKEPFDSSRSRWDVVFGSFYGDSSRREQLAIEISYFLKEIEFALVKLDFDEDKELIFFKNVYENLNRYRYGVEDELNTLFSLLWGLFAAWSWIDGYSDDDFVCKRIDSC
ncbi:hypothetical protein [Maridesulfovibrio sp.]|uniref:hypothetical protein n=1 Tax=Maridesulfovibrio sp. TaxID=2795000 RepID=UPI003BAABCFD